MWYVVQTKSDNEQQVLDMLKNMAEPGMISNLFIPAFEDVRKKDGKAHIILRRLFPGYFFVDTDQPKAVFDVLKMIPEFTRLLGGEDNDGDKLFVPVGKDDEAFLDSLMENGVMRVSFVKKAKSGRIDQIIGPLSKYSNRIIKLDVSRRRAIVKADIFGKERKLKFGLWTEDDSPLAWITDMQESGSEEKALLKGVADIGIHPGDKVVDETGVYEDKVFTVSGIDAGRRKVYATIEMFGSTVNIQFDADSVRKL